MLLDTLFTPNNTYTINNYEFLAFTLAIVSKYCLFNYENEHSRHHIF